MDLEEKGHKGTITQWVIPDDINDTAIEVCSQISQADVQADTSQWNWYLRRQIRHKGKSLPRNMMYCNMNLCRTSYAPLFISKVNVLHDLHL